MDDPVQDWTAVLALGIALITFVVLVRKHIARPFVKWMHKQLHDFFQETMGPDIATIKHEVTTNSGGSLKDAVKEVQTDLTTIHQRLDELGDQGARDSAKVIHTIHPPEGE